MTTRGKASGGWSWLRPSLMSSSLSTTASGCQHVLDRTEALKAVGLAE